MMSSLFIGATGMKTHGEGLNTVGNNLANVNTVGYKQQSVMFDDLVRRDLVLGSSWSQMYNQQGLGVAVGSVRTIFTDGGLESGSAATDMAIIGKGFFQVSDGEDLRYTRAGNFRFTADGYLQDPNGLTLTGIPLNNGVSSGLLEGIHVDFNDMATVTSPGRASSLLTATLNAGTWEDRSSTDPANPYFNLVQRWNGAAVTGGGAYDASAERAAPPLDPGAYSGSVPLTVYDASGTAHTLTLYLDGAPSAGSGSTYEFVLAAAPEEMVGPGGIPATGTGLLMAGTLRFSSAGELTDMSAFTPSGGNPADLASWSPAALTNGLPSFGVQFAGQPAQTLTLDLGVRSASGTWAGATTAAGVGADARSLPSLESPVLAANAATAYSGTANLKRYTQDGYAEGSMSNLEVTADGYVRATYSNGQSADLYSIPLFRFTSEDGLRHEGNNLYSATEACGAVEYGLASTSNYGTIQSYQLETSNVDMATEMVNMILMQRGFQMNSKAVTTSDAMLQKALELKRT